jgi:hypothetical protein
MPVMRPVMDVRAGKTVGKEGNEEKKEGTEEIKGKAKGKEKEKGGEAIWGNNVANGAHRARYTRAAAGARRLETAI